jgi:hypothetical protein
MGRCRGDHLAEGIAGRQNGQSRVQLGSAGLDPLTDVVMDAFLKDWAKVSGK